VSKTLSRGYAGYAVLLLFLANIANYGQRMIVSILLPGIKADIGLTDEELGILMGGGFAVCYAIAGVPLARFAERHGRVRWLSIALAFWSLATGLFGVARTFFQMLLARIALGTGQSMCIPTSHSLLGDYVKTANRPFALGVHSAGGVLGATLAMVLGGYLGVEIGWRSTLGLFAIGGGVLAGVVALTLPDPSRASAAAIEGGGLPLGAAIRRLVGVRSYILVLVSVCFAMLVEYGLNQWLPSYYVREFSLSVQKVGFCYGIAIALGGIPGSVLGGMVVASLARRDVRWLVWFPALMYVVGIPIGLSMLLAPKADIAFVLNACYALLIYGTNGALWGACFVHIPPAMRATTSAITLLVAGIAGLAVGPVLVGAASDSLTPRFGNQALQISLVAVECLAVLVVVPLILAGLFVAREGEPQGTSAQGPESHRVSAASGVQ
jgi:predicted MFS family arabinose efflux permease